MQKSEVIESDSFDEANSDYQGTLHNMANGDPMVRVFSLAKLKQQLKTFDDRENHPVDAIDKRLIKGFYTNDQQELQDEDPGIANQSDEEPHAFAHADNIKITPRKQTTEHESPKNGSAFFDEYPSLDHAK